MSNWLFAILWGVYVPDYIATDSSDFLECLLVTNIQSQQIRQHRNTHKTKTCRFHTRFNKENEQVSLKAQMQQIYIKELANRFCLAG